MTWSRGAPQEQRTISRSRAKEMGGITIPLTSVSLEKGRVSSELGMCQQVTHLLSQCLVKGHRCSFWIANNPSQAQGGTSVESSDEK